MKYFSIISGSLVFMILITTSCRNETEVKSEDAGSSDPGLVPVGKDMITEVVVRPDTLGDPWEVEKVKGFSGTQMYKLMLEDIYSGKLKVYDVLNEEIMKPADVKKLVNEFNNDLARIAKLQFLEDWYYDPAKKEIIKKIRSVSFGYEVQRDGGLPPGYFPLFRLRPD